MRLFLKAFLLSTKLKSFEFHAIHKDGHVLQLMSKPTRLIIDGGIIGFQAIIIDLTERRKAEERVESEEKYRAQFEEALACMHAITIPKTHTK